MTFKFRVDGNVVEVDGPTKAEALEKASRVLREIGFGSTKPREVKEPKS